MGDDVEVHAVVLDGELLGVGGGGWTRGVFDEEFFAFELEFLAFEFELGEFFDVGEHLREQMRGRLSAHVFKGNFAENLIHGGLEARGMIGPGLFRDVDEDIQGGTGGGSEIFSAPSVAETSNGLETDLDPEPFGNWFGDTTP